MWCNLRVVEPARCADSLPMVYKVQEGHGADSAPIQRRSGAESEPVAAVTMTALAAVVNRHAAYALSAAGRSFAGIDGHAALRVDLVDARLSPSGQQSPCNRSLLFRQRHSAAKEDFHLGPPIQSGKPGQPLSCSPYSVEPIGQTTAGARRRCSRRTGTRNTPPAISAGRRLPIAAGHATPETSRHCGLSQDARQSAYNSSLVAEGRARLVPWVSA